MNCKSCGKRLFFSAEMCVECENGVEKMEAFKRHYSQQRLNGYALRYAIIDLRREKYSLKNIAYILDRDIDLITDAMDLILQDGA